MNIYWTNLYFDLIEILFKKNQLLYKFIFAEKEGKKPNIDKNLIIDHLPQLFTLIKSKAENILS